VYSGREQRSYVIRVVTRNFLINSFSNDIALLQLKNALRLDGKGVAPVCLPQPDRKYSSGERLGLPVLCLFTGMLLVKIDGKI